MDRPAAPKGSVGAPAGAVTRRSAVIVDLQALLTLSGPVVISKGLLLGVGIANSVKAQGGL